MKTTPCRIALVLLLASVPASTAVAMTPEERREYRDRLLAILPESSTKRGIGFYLINPSVEYLSGGPTKPEFLCHRDTTRVQAPVVLNYWRSSHYGGANVTVDPVKRGPRSSARSCST